MCMLEAMGTREMSMDLVAEGDILCSFNGDILLLLNRTCFHVFMHALRYSSFTNNSLFTSTCLSGVGKWSLDIGFQTLTDPKVGDIVTALLLAILLIFWQKRSATLLP